MGVSETAHLEQTKKNINPDVIVVGSGLGGLTTALELARYGLSTCVLEQHNVAGGYAHSFQRKGYKFDISLHYIGGLSPGNLTFSILQNLGVFEKLRIIKRENLFYAGFPDFEITLPNDADEILNFLSAEFPGEKNGIYELFNYLPKLKEHVVFPNIDPDFNVSQGDLLSVKHINHTFLDLLKNFVKDPRLLAILGQTWTYLGLPPSMSTANYSTCVFCSSFMEGAYHIVGGGASLVRCMIERLRELGGECFTSSDVKRIIVEDGEAKGVRLKDGQEIRSKIVVSGANPYHTFFDLLKEKDISQIFRHRLKKMESSLSMYSLYLGLDCPPSHLGINDGNYFHNHGLDFNAAYKKMCKGNVDKTDYCATSYENTDDSICPPGSSVINFAELTSAEDWFDLENDDYQDKKQKVKNKLILKYSSKFKGLKDHIDISEFGTPRTMKRYTRNYMGAVYGFAQTIGQSNSKRLRNRTPVKNLFLTGAWTWSGGGYEGSIMTGLLTAGAVLDELERPLKKAIFNVDRKTFNPDKKSLKKDTSKKIEGTGELETFFEHKLNIKVYGDELNSRGNADASAYLKYMDRGRVEAIEQICAKHKKNSWLKDYTVNVYRIKADMNTSVRLGDNLQVLTGLHRTSSHRASFEQEIIDFKTSKCILKATVEVLFLDKESHLVQIPDEINILKNPNMHNSLGILDSTSFDNKMQFPFKTPFRVYYEDTDCQQITYHVSYSRFCERALFDLIQSVWPEINASSWMPRFRGVISKMDLRYLKSSILGDMIEVHTGIIDASKDSITFGQRVYLAGNNQVLADIATSVEFQDENGNTTNLPPQIMDATKAFMPIKNH